MRQLEEYFALAMKVFAGLCFVFIVALVVINVVARGAANLPDGFFAGPDWLVPILHSVADFLFGLSASWFEEITQLLTGWMVFIGAAALWREKKHFRAEIIDTLLSRRATRYIVLGTTIFSLIFLLVLTYYGWVLVERTTTTSSILQWPREWWLVSVPVGAAIMALYSLWDLAAGLAGIVTGRDLERQAGQKGEAP